MKSMQSWVNEPYFILANIPSPEAPVLSNHTVIPEQFRKVRLRARTVCAIGAGDNPCLRGCLRQCRVEILNLIQRQHLRAISKQQINMITDHAAPRRAG